MKKLIFAMSLLAAQFSFAGRIDWTTDLIPSEVQQVIQATVAAECNVYHYRVKEADTQVRLVRVDQGVIDYFYTVTLSASHKIDQIMFEDGGTIEIQVGEYSVSNPTAGNPIQVLSLRADGEVSCK